jgi:hypothetical protein
MKKILPVAVMTALAGVNSAHAVHVNSDGLGQVLLYPFYTSEGGQDTYINVVNTTPNFKAVKVRILESMNSVEVLDFNLYMSPRDHWSAVITADPSGEGAMIVTADTSCTVPNALSNGTAIPFRNFQYADDTLDNSLARTKEGYVEVIEMGVVDTSNPIVVDTSTGLTLGTLLAGAIAHDNGVPGSCATLSALWSSSTAWGGSPTLAMLPAAGGLYGYGVLIDVAEGTDATYDATALNEFFDPLGQIFHTDPGSILPNLGNAAPTFSIFDDGGVVTGSTEIGLDAVSATMMVAGIANDFVLEPTILAGTDWVITFPTKREYVDPGVAGADGNQAIAPFTGVWGGAVQPPGTPFAACEAIGIEYWDREEEGVAPGGLDFSPQPPGPSAFALCAEANVLTFNSSNVLKASSRSGADLTVIHDNGWAALSFTNSVFTTQPSVASNGANPAYNAGVARQLVTGGGIFNGLPAIGFAVQKYVNGDVGGVLSNYAGSVTHKGDRLITSGV